MQNIGGDAGNGGMTPALAVINITNVYAQWVVAIIATASSFLADR